MSPAEVVWHMLQMADDRYQDLHDGSLAARAATNKDEAWKKYLKGLGFDAA